ncbi:MAG: ATP-binding protein [Candidatus Omnitrophota bacterium]
MNNARKEELLKKYRWAGKIRFLSASLLLLFLLLMKFFGGYSYINYALIGLFVIEAVANQPRRFITDRVNLERLQYYHMTLDIIAISWVVYYMGGLEAPVVNIAYYAIILWAGVVSTFPAVFFAALMSSCFFTLAVLLEYLGLFPAVSYYGHRMPPEQMMSILIGHVSFFFAFGFFSAHSSRMIMLLERMRREESFRNTHKLIATGHLVGSFAHDILNYLFSIRGHVKMMMDDKEENSNEYEQLMTISRLEKKSAELLLRLAKFSKEREREPHPADMNKIVKDTLEITWPLVRSSYMTVKHDLDDGIPPVKANVDQVQEAFVEFVMNALDAMRERGTLTIRTRYAEKDGMVEIIFSDTGSGMKREEIAGIGEPFFVAKEGGQGPRLGLGLASACSIVARHHGTMDIKSAAGSGTTITIRFPAAKTHAKIKAEGGKADRAAPPENGGAAEGE